MLDVKKLCKKYGNVRGIHRRSCCISSAFASGSLLSIFFCLLRWQIPAPLNEMAKNGKPLSFSEDREKLKREAEAARRLGAAAEFVNTVPLPFAAGGAVKVKGQAQFHPLKFLKG